MNGTWMGCCAFFTGRRLVYGPHRQARLYRKRTWSIRALAAPVQVFWLTILSPCAFPIALR